LFQSFLMIQHYDDLPPSMNCLSSCFKLEIQFSICNLRTLILILIFYLEKKKMKKRKKDDQGIYR